MNLVVKQDEVWVTPLQGQPDFNWLITYKTTATPTRKILKAVEVTERSNGEFFATGCIPVVD